MKPTTKTKVLYDSPEAARLETMQVWMSRGGRAYPSHQPNSEHFARWDGCTHEACDCGREHERGWTCCEDCRAKKQRERYEKFMLHEGEIEFPLALYDDERFFWYADELDEYIDEYEIDVEDLMLVACEKRAKPQIDLGHMYEDYLAEDMDSPWSEDIRDAVNKLQSLLDAEVDEVWEQVAVRVKWPQPESVEAP